MSTVVGFFVLLTANIRAEILTPCLQFGYSNTSGCKSTCDYDYGRHRVRVRDHYGRHRDEDSVGYLGSFQNDSEPFEGHRVCGPSSSCTLAPGTPAEENKWRACSNPQAPAYCLQDRHYCSGCLAGQYCPTGTISLGNHSENLCPAGYYCNKPSERIVCPAGHFCLEGSARPMPCKSGYYCNEGTSMFSGTASMDSCARVPGMIPGHQCVITCPIGYYCDNPANITLCPEGYFCPQGSMAPLLCGALYSCKAGAGTRSLSAEFYVMFCAGIVSMAVLVALMHVYVHLVWQCVVAKCNSPNLTTEPPEPSGWMVPHPISLKAEHLGLELANGKSVLHDVNMEIKSGTVVAVMGQSGSGKTSLLNVLCGRAYYGTTIGTLMMHTGTEQWIKTSVSSIRSHVGFVPQDDVVRAALTVEENLYYSARIRLKNETTEQEIMQILESTLELLHISDVRHVKVGSIETRGISGGQRKRVNIGLELITRPSVIFLDEPTSGLDAATSRCLVHSLKCLSQQGVTVVSTIHQPRTDTFHEFDSVILLASGSPVYVGMPCDIVAYMQGEGFRLPLNENPADWLLDIVSGRYDSDELPRCVDLIELWRKCTLNPARNLNPALEYAQFSQAGGPRKVRNLESDTLNISPMTGPPAWKRLLIIICRDVRQRRAEARKYMIYLTCFAGGGFFVGLGSGDMSVKYTYPHDQSLYVFLNILSCTAVLHTFCDDKVIFWREIACGFTRESYFISQNLLDFLTVTIYVLAFWLIYMAMCTPLQEPVLMFTTMLLMVWSTTGMAYNFSIYVANPHLAVLCTCLIQNILLSGIFPGFRMSEGVTYPPFWISPTRWGLEMITVSYFNEWNPPYKHFGQFSNSTRDITWWGWEPSTTGSSHWSPAWKLVLQGLVWRAIALLGLFIFAISPK